MMPVDTYHQGIMYGSVVVAGLGGGMRSTIRVHCEINENVEKTLRNVKKKK